MSTNLFEQMKQYQVSAASVEDFLERYGKPQKYHLQGEEYKAILVIYHKESIGQFGFTMLSPHDSVTGKTVSYYPASPEKQPARTSCNWWDAPKKEK